RGNCHKSVTIRRSKFLLDDACTMPDAAYAGMDRGAHDRGVSHNHKKQNVEIRQGDVVIFHTGWLSLIGKDDKRYSAGEPGLGVQGAKYLTGKGVVAIGADTWALEVLPFESKNVFEVHQILLAMNGTYILENMDTAAIARD